MNNSIKIKKGEKRVFLLIKILITLTLCAVIIWKGDWENFWNGIQRADLFLLEVVLLLTMVSIAISALKWQILLSIHGIYFKFRKLLRYYFTASFFNNFFPTNIGGDGYRIYKTLNNSHSKSCAVIAVFMDRFTGIVALLCLGYIGGIVSYLRNGDEISRIIVIIGSAGTMAAIPCLYLIYNKNTMRWLEKRVTLPKRIKMIIEYLGDYHNHPVKILQAVTISFVFHTIILFWTLLLVKAVGASCSLYHLIIVLTASTVIAMLPVSINGIGVMDGSFIYLIGRYGVGYEAALTVMILKRALEIIISLLGGILYLKESHSAAGKRISFENIESIKKW